jgi:hypothetical protein
MKPNRKSSINNGCIRISSLIKAGVLNCSEKEIQLNNINSTWRVTQLFGAGGKLSCKSHLTTLSI